MAAYRVWKAGAGGLTITVRPLRTFLFSPLLSLIAPSGKDDVAFLPDAGDFTADLSAAQVAKLIAAPTGAGAPFLFLTTHAVYKPGAPDRKWQWGIKLQRGGTALSCFDKDGNEVAPGPHGFVTSALRSFPDGQAYGSDTWIMSLA